MTPRLCHNQCRVVFDLSRVHGGRQSSSSPPSAAPHQSATAIEMWLITNVDCELEYRRNRNSSTKSVSRVCAKTYAWQINWRTDKSVLRGKNDGRFLFRPRAEVVNKRRRIFGSTPMTCRMPARPYVYLCCGPNHFRCRCALNADRRWCPLTGPPRRFVATPPPPPPPLLSSSCSPNETTDYIFCFLFFRFINARRRIVQPMIDQSNRAGMYENCDVAPRRAWVLCHARKNYDHGVIIVIRNYRRSRIAQTDAESIRLLAAVVCVRISGEQPIITDQ